MAWGRGRGGWHRYLLAGWAGEGQKVAAALRELPGGTALEGRGEGTCLWSPVAGDGQGTRPGEHPPPPPSPLPVMALLHPLSQI